jgi:hypothetical protein
MKIQNFIISGLVLFSLTAFLSCSAADVVGREGLKSFDAVSKKLGSIDSKGNLVLRSPAGTEDFTISSDFSASEYDLFFSMDITDFFAAGLDPFSLDGKAFLPGKAVFDSSKGILNFSFPVSDRKVKNDLTPAELFIELSPDKLGYHAQFDHYGFDIGGGIMVEWAADTASNDKDLVFVIDPVPFIEAGLETDKLDNWIYGAVTVMDKKTKKPVEVFKLLRVYNTD